MPADPVTARVDAVLAEFRGWLTDLFTAHPETTASPTAVPPTVDLASVVAQFTALRHEVNLQTKASRLAVDQTAEALKLAAAPKPGPDPDDVVKPLVKAIIDIADALAVSSRQIEKSQEVLEPLMEQLPEWDLPDPPSLTASAPRPGLVARLLGKVPPAETDPAWSQWADEVLADAADRTDDLATVRETLLPLIAGLADGYAMSLRRVERVLPQFGLEAIPSVGEPFDPELMEAVELVAGDGQSGTVVEEVRRGYRWKNTVFRFAQVKVAR